MKKCCLCVGGAPSFRCSCPCHRQEDLEYWEVMAFVWIYDAPHAQAREEQWKRFRMAYPEHARERCNDFWERILRSRWYNKHKHHYHHGHGGGHHEYGDDD